MVNTLTEELEVALAAVRQAAKVTAAVQKDLVTQDTLEKEDKSPVTVADFASQAIICAALEAAFATDPVVGEEDAAELREGAQATLLGNVVKHVNVIRKGASEQEVLEWIDRGAADGQTDRYWTLDPIDGTKGFLRGEQYAIALALIEKGQVVLGVLGCPNLDGGLMISAVQGQGTFTHELEGDEIEGEPVAVSDLDETEDARFCESVESGHSDQGQSAMIAKKLGIKHKPVRMDSQAKYVTVARGIAQIYLRLPTRKSYHEKIWDHAAGMIVVQEAGGTVSDVQGEPLDFGHGRTLANNRGIIATGGRIHPRVVKVVSKILNPRPRK